MKKAPRQDVDRTHPPGTVRLGGAFLLLLGGAIVGPAGVAADCASLTTL